ncbi:hypothetical protein [Ornithinicoccus hortensis]|uniref:Uncharacterized protein n=1 Tax=Ornithinicoccus hortensis TaxID=82346 RepID=A0A542YWK8_9MICO|nr:hypothetical protein [Ornithinicoccus hortensis]TQL52443.1 hypothetical protein FB467_3629 [Ornithinicoccus hortensis]
MRATTSSPRIILTAAVAAIALAVGVVPAQAAGPGSELAPTVATLTDGEVDPQFRMPDLCSLVPWVC